MEDFANFNGGKGESAGGADPLMQEALSIAARFHGKGENELIKEIYARAEESKRKGTLTNAEIDTFFCRISPMLDGAKRKKLEKLVEKLKEI